MSTRVYRDGNFIKLVLPTATIVSVGVDDFDFNINETTGQVNLIDTFTPITYKEKGINLEDKSGLKIGSLGQIEFYLNLITGPAVTGGATSKRNFAFSGARSTPGGADRDMRAEGVLTNTTPLIIPYNCELQLIVASTNGAETWEAHIYKNGVSAAFLSVVAVNKLISSPLSVSFSAGDEVRLRQENGTGSINRPRIEAHFKEV